MVNSFNDGDWQNDSTQKKMFHKIFRQIWEITKKNYMCFLFSYLRIDHSKSFVDFKIKKILSLFFIGL